VIGNLKHYLSQPDRDLDAELDVQAAGRERLVATSSRTRSGSTVTRRTRMPDIRGNKSVVSMRPPSLGREVPAPLCAQASLISSAYHRLAIIGTA